MEEIPQVGSLELEKALSLMLTVGFSGVFFWDFFCLVLVDAFYQAKDIPFWNSPGGLIVKTVLPLQGYDWLRVGFPCGSAGKEFACNAGDLG